MIIAPYQIWVKKNKTGEYEEAKKWTLYIIIGTIPAGFIGLVFKDQIEQIFSSVLLVIIMLFITGTLMIMARFIKNKDIALNFPKSFLIGMAQAFAILPGISRSGSTIVTGMLLGVDRSKAAEFSFLLSIPAILGAGVIKTKDLLESPMSSDKLILLILGTIAAFISGYIAIIWLLDIVKKGKLEWFGVYCYAVVLITGIWYFLI
jgi:undecaprenyl-diphosphatase